MHCVDLGESFPTHVFFQNLASIQPRTSLVKFACSPRTDPPDPPGRKCVAVPMTSSPCSIASAQRTLGSATQAQTPSPIRGSLQVPRFRGPHSSKRRMEESWMSRRYSEIVKIAFRLKYKLSNYILQCSTLLFFRDIGDVILSFGIHSTRKSGLLG